MSIEAYYRWRDRADIHIWGLDYAQLNAHEDAIKKAWGAGRKYERKKIKEKRLKEKNHVN